MTGLKDPIKPRGHQSKHSLKSSYRCGRNMKTLTELTLGFTVISSKNHGEARKLEPNGKSIFLSIHHPSSPMVHS